MARPGRAGTEAVGGGRSPADGCTEQYAAKAQVMGGIGTCRTGW